MTLKLLTLDQMCFTRPFHAYKKNKNKNPALSCFEFLQADFELIDFVLAFELILELVLGFELFQGKKDCFGFDLTSI